MSKKNKPVLGRPRKELVLPKSNKFTISDIFAANGENIKCRLTVYARVKEMVKAKALKRTQETLKTGKVGTPGTIFYRMSAWNSLQKKRHTRKTVKLASAPPVDLTPAPAPAETAPVIDTVPATA